MKKQIMFFSFFREKKLCGTSDDSNHTWSCKSLFLKCFIVLMLTLSLFSAEEASATHFRYGNITWKRVPGNNSLIEFKVSQAWRRSYPWGLPGGAPNVGSIITTGAMSFGAGQGSTNVNLQITSINMAEDWVYGEATITHQYPANAANYLVVFSGCCRISNLQGGNNDRDYINQTMVTIGNLNDAPVSTMPPFINRPNNAITTFQIPAVDPNGHTIAYSLTPLAETGLVSFTSGVSVSPGGLVTFNPAGKGLNTLWAVSVKITDQLGAFIVVDFIIQVVGPSVPPVFTYPPTPANNFTYLRQPGQNLNFQIRATDPDVGSTVSLTGVGIPVGATFTPVIGNPALTSFNWTPAMNQLGTYVINFTATDDVGVQTNTIVNVLVSLAPNFDVPPTPGNNSTICILPGTTRTDVFRASDPDPQDEVSINAIGIGPNMSFSPAMPTAMLNPSQTTLTYSPVAANWGLKHLVFTATDSYNETAQTNMYYIVNNAPTFTSVPVVNAIANQLYTYTITTDDLNIPQGDEVGVESSSFPPFLNLVDNLDGTFTLSGIPSIADIGTYNVMIEIEDELNHINGTHCGNNSQTFVLNVQGTVPTITCPADISTSADAGMCSKSNVTYAAVATGIPAPNVTYSVPSGSTFNVGTYTITATADNGVGTATCIFTVSITDNEVPTITCAADVSVSNDAGTCGATVALTPPQVSDNCPGVGSPTNNAPGVFPVGTTSVLWTVMDNHGNVNTCTQTVTVNDTENPIITCSGPVTVPNDAGTCGATVVLTPPQVSDNCPGVGSPTNNAPGVFPVGTTSVLWTVMDNHGNVNTCTQTVTVNDVQKPIVSCKPFTLNLQNGTGTVNADDIDNGSSDNCAIAMRTVSPNVFTCDDAGILPVTLVVTDASGNAESCTALVTVQYQPTCSIVSVPSNNVYTGGNPNNIYLGYGPQSATLNSTVIGGTDSIYSWAPSTYLSCTNCADPVFTPLAAGTITYTLTVTNTNGCTTQCLVTMCVINAVATGKGNNGKVIICHVPPGNANNPQTLSISPNAVASHLTGHAGDQLGACGQSCGAAKGMDAVEGQLLENNGFETIVYPNPTNSDFTIVINAESKGAVQAAMYDMLGKKISDLKGMEVNVPYTVDQPLSSGIYFIHIQHNGYTQSVRLIKQDH